MKEGREKEKECQNSLGEFDPRFVGPREFLESVGHLLDSTHDFAVVVIVLSSLDVVPAEDFGFPHVGGAFPVEEVHLLEEFLLVELEFTHRHG